MIAMQEPRTDLRLKYVAEKLRRRLALLREAADAIKKQPGLIDGTMLSGVLQQIRTEALQGGMPPMPQEPAGGASAQ